MCSAQTLTVIPYIKTHCRHQKLRKLSCSLQMITPVVHVARKITKIPFSGASEKIIRKIYFSHFT